MSDEIPVIIRRKNATIGDAIIAIFLINGFMIPWMMGVVLAKGFWATLCAIFFFPYAWYLTVELFMQKMGLI